MRHITGLRHLDLVIAGRQPNTGLIGRRAVQQPDAGLGRFGPHGQRKRPRWLRRRRDHRRQLVDLDLNGIDVLALNLAAAQQRSRLGVDQPRRDRDQVAQLVDPAGHYRVHAIPTPQFGGGPGIEQTGGAQFLGFGNRGGRRQRQAVLQGETAGIGDSRHHQIGDDRPGLLVQFAPDAELDHRRRHPVRGRLGRRSNRSNRQPERQHQRQHQPPRFEYGLAHTGSTTLDQGPVQGSSARRNPKSKFRNSGTTEKR